VIGDQKPVKADDGVQMTEKPKTCLSQRHRGHRVRLKSGNQLEG